MPTTKKNPAIPPRGARFRDAFLLALALLLASSGCRQERDEPSASAASASEENGHVEAPEHSASPTRAWSGPLAELLPPTTPAWIYVDTAALRAHPQAGPLLNELSLGASDVLSRALVEADEVAVGWQDIELQERLTILRTRATNDAISSALERGEMPGTGQQLNERRVREFRAWDDASNGWSIALPAPNILITGPAEMVSASLIALDEAENEAGPNAGAQVVYGVDLPMAVRRELATAIDRPVANRQIYALERIYGGIAFDEDLDMTMRLAMPSGGSPTMAATIVRMGAEAMLPDLLGQLFQPLYVQRLMANIAVEAQEAPRRGVLITATLPQEDTELWSAALLQTMRDDGVPTETVPATDDDVSGAAPDERSGEASGAGDEGSAEAEQP